MASIEHDLFIEWMEWLQSHSPLHKFTYDGIVCIEEWQATPTKIMLVLKDYNDSSHADRHRPLDKFNLKDREAVKANVPNLRYHLANSISDKRNWRTWNNAARWVYGLLNTRLGYYPPYTDVNIQGDSIHRTINMRKVAVLDLKKSPGRSSCTKSMLNAYFNQHPEAYPFLARQISLYGHLDFVVCCGDGVFDHLQKIVQNSMYQNPNYIVKYKRKNYLITESGTIIIDYRHPLLLKNGISSKLAYTQLMEIVQSALKERADKMIISQH